MEQTLSDRITVLSPVIRRIAQFYAASDTQADDLYQSSVEQILKRCPQDATRSYICQLVVWHCKNVTHAARIYTKYVTTVDDKMDDEGEWIDAFEIIFDPNVPTPEEILIEIETSKEILKIVEKIDPVNQQIASLLSGGLNHREISERIGLSRRAVSFRVKEIRRAFLASDLAAYYR